MPPQYAPNLDFFLELHQDSKYNFYYIDEDKVMDEIPLEKIMGRILGTDQKRIKIE